LKFSRVFYFRICQVDQSILTNLSIDLILKCQTLDIFSKTVSLNYSFNHLVENRCNWSIVHFLFIDEKNDNHDIGQYSTHFHAILQSHTLHATENIYFSQKVFGERTTHFSICVVFYNVASIILPKGGCHSRCCEGRRRRYRRRYRWW